MPLHRKGISMPDFSVFDLVPITQGSTPEIALHHALELAQKAEA
jgi:hypothetical protein